MVMAKLKNFMMVKGEYLNGKNMEKEKNMILIVIWYLKVNIQMEWEFYHKTNNNSNLE